MLSKKHIRVIGRVQGVFFRHFAQKEASKLGLAGSVQNNSNGSVEIKVSGNDKDIYSFINWCHAGSPASKVEQVIVKELSEDITSKEFLIIR